MFFVVFGLYLGGRVPHYFLENVGAQSLHQDVLFEELIGVDSLFIQQGHESQELEVVLIHFLGRTVLLIQNDLQLSEHLDQNPLLHDGALKKTGKIVRPLQILLVDQICVYLQTEIGELLKALDLFLCEFHEGVVVDLDDVMRLEVLVELEHNQTEEVFEFSEVDGLDLVFVVEDVILEPPEDLHSVEFDEHFHVNSIEEAGVEEIVVELVHQVDGLPGIEGIFFLDSLHVVQNELDVGLVNGLVDARYLTPRRRSWTWWTSSRR